jgi:hypothetical protein
MELVFILAHGTFARKSTWIEADSDFSRALKKQFEHDTVFVTPFRWSGRNAAAARATASRELAECARCETRQHPNAQCFIVGHSHGGSIAATTLALNRDVGIRGVTCLSTPFIHVREHATSASTLPWTLYGISTLAAALPFAFLIQNSGSRFAAVAVGAPVIGMIASFLGGLILDEFVASDHARRLNMPCTQGLSLYMIRVASDEASAALGLASLATWFTRRWRSVFENGFGLLAAICMVLAFVGLLGAAAMSSTGWSFWANVDASNRVEIALTGLLLIAMWGTILASVICFLMLFAAMALSAVAFGYDSWMAICAADVSAEETPAGEWIVNQLSSAMVAGGDPFLRHSATWRDPRVPYLIAAWVRSVLSNGSNRGTE